MNETKRPPERPATNPITGLESSSCGGSSWPRCESCGARFPAIEYLERHLTRSCNGPVGEPRVVCVRLPREERARFARRLRNMS